jgi:hypothetical protein
MDQGQLESLTERPLDAWTSQDVERAVLAPLLTEATAAA